MQIPMEYRIMFVFALIIAILLAERQFAFDIKQRLKMFAGFFIAVFISLLIAYHALESVSEYFRSMR
ncbi:hypothetical protein A3A55_04590 [Candidatus Roizmanbacteria bacterium RIFCSPLOWO2_01_FULL_40_14]|nr:MAG: hypothetical protein A3A55_04590 [Candidatus Roizmanbacteria bacterium RIFCSPLOWO2_01_FULL_40_14]